VSNQIDIPYEALGEASIKASIELEFKRKLQDEKIFAPHETVSTISSLIANQALTDYDAQVKQQIKSFSCTPDASRSAEAKCEEKTEAVVNGIISDLMISGSGLHDWFMGTFRTADNKLKELAVQIKKEADRLKVTVEEYLSALRKQLFSWILENSVVGSFVVTGSNGATTFTPSKISSKGSFEFGPLGASINSLEGIIGALKVLPKITIDISVDYSNPSAATPKKE